MSRMERIEREEKDTLWAKRLIAQIQKQGFYGKLTLTFEQGLVRRAIKEESIKPPHSEEKESKIKEN